MFLSNRQVAALGVSLVIFAAAGCTWFRGSEPSESNTAAVTPPDRGIPFETKEPGTYQADFYTVAAGSETRSHFARNGALWRYDSFDGGQPSKSIIRADLLAYVDHERKVYSEPPLNGPDARPAFIEDLTTSLLHPKQPAKFEKIAAEENIVKYSVKTEGSKDPTIITYDTTIKMIVRHDFEGGFAFEMRNFTLEVDDAIFRLPSGYRKVSWPEYNRP